jgi:hypothetical protein
MKIEGRILQSLRPRRHGVLLRSEIRDFGSDSQLTSALKSLVTRGIIVRLAPGVYAKAESAKLVGPGKLLSDALERQETIRSKERRAALKRYPRFTPTARFVRRMAELSGVRFTATYGDRWADTVTRLAGDEVRTDATDDLLVALARAGKLTPQEMTNLVMAHHRELRGV